MKTLSWSQWKNLISDHEESWVDLSVASPTKSITAQPVPVPSTAETSTPTSSKKETTSGNYT